MLCGPSGSGKSTILRIIAGLEAADSGEVQLTGEDATHLRVQDRGVGFVFQHYALFRHMSVRQNVAFGLEVQKRPAREIRDRVDELLEPVQMTAATETATHHAALGRSAAAGSPGASAWHLGPRCCYWTNRPAALDARPRRATHVASPPTRRSSYDQPFRHSRSGEAFEVADQSVVLNRGRVEQMGPPQELYERPSTPFVTGFLGSVNVLQVPSEPGTTVIGDGLHLPADVKSHDAPISVYVRPHDLDLTHERNGRPSWAGQVVRAR